MGRRCMPSARSRPEFGGQVGGRSQDQDEGADEKAEDGQTGGRAVLGCVTQVRVFSCQCCPTRDSLCNLLPKQMTSTNTELVGNEEDVGFWMRIRPSSIMP
eukprot:1721659-Pyramimonas_sp.AAC.1